MHNLKINCIKPGLYEIQEKGIIYKMELIWLSRLQRDIFNLEKSESPVANWYNQLDEGSKSQIKIRSARKLDNSEPQSI